MLPYCNLEEIKKLRKKYSIKEDEKVLLFIGRLTALKNIFFLAKSLKALKDKNFKFKMLFVGVGNDEDKLKSQIKKLKLTEEVVFTGKIVDRIEISKYYKMADLLFISIFI